MDLAAVAHPRRAAAPRLAATVILARPAAEAPELLLLRRHARSGFAAKAWVFPGGTLDERDADLDPRRWRGIHPQALAPRFRLGARAVLAVHVAAVRETFEEAGLLLARHTGGQSVDLRQPGYAAVRAAMNERGAEVDFGAFLDEHDLVLDLDRLTYWSRWVTPFVEPRRYDTCFFLARAPESQDAAHDAVETVDLRWIRARDALADDSFSVIYPTQRTLEELAPLRSLEDAVAVAEARADVRSIQPHVVVDDEGAFVGILHPDEPGYPHELYAAGGAP